MKLTKRDVDDVYRLDFGSGTAPIILSEEEMDELRAHLQAERDDALGRWRDTENPNIVVYPHPTLNDDDGRRIWLINELSGAAWLDWERGAPPGPARRYFDAHPLPEPKPKPWETAKPGEVWLVTLSHCEPQICQVLKTHRFLPNQTENGYQRPVFPLDHPTIITARKIWPEGDSDD